MLRFLGWTAVDGPAPEKKCIILGVPHTSIWDFPISYFFYHSFDADAKVMIKDGAFFWPLGNILRKLGAVPVDRKSPTAALKSIIRQINEADYFHLAMCPEGTRKPVAKWKTGFHTIARETGVPVYLGYFDWGRKRIGRGEKFELTDDPKADMERIQQIYEQMQLTGKHKENYRTH